MEVRQKDVGKFGDKKQSICFCENVGNEKYLEEYRTYLRNTVQTSYCPRLFAISVLCDVIMALG